MDYHNPPKKQNKHKSRGWFDRTTVKLPDTWRYGKKTKAQWIQAFEEEAKH
jgi:hypothetical protein